MEDLVVCATESDPMHAKAASLLLRAIEDADEDTLKHVLKSMCGASPECSAAASRFLLTRRGQLQKGGEGEEETDGEGDHNDEDGEKKVEANGARLTKRRKLNGEFTGVDAELMSRYETCAVCKKRFDLVTNNSKACRVHDGDLEIDEGNDGWADDDEYRDEPNGIDPYTDWRRDGNPGLFKWNCCDGNAHAKPCVISKHVLK